MHFALYGGNLAVAGVHPHSLNCCASILRSCADGGLEGRVNVLVLIACIVPHSQRERHLHMLLNVCIGTTHWR